MARKESSKKDELKFRNKARKKSGWGMFFRIVASSPVWQLILLLIIAGLLWWQWPNIVYIADYIWRWLGWGLVFIAAAIITLAVQIKRGKIASFLFHWYRWLGVIAFILAIWGMLAFFEFGGSLGLGIIGAPDYIGALRVLALVIIGIVLEAPRECFHLLVSFFAWIGERFRRRRTLRRPVSPEHQQSVHQVVYPRTAIENNQPPATEAERDIPAELATARAQLEAMAEQAEAGTMVTPAKQDLRQVAQDVWKKYGQSPGLVVMDGWRLPPIEILDMTPEVEFSQADNMQRAKLIEDALSSYGVEAKVVQINAGPTLQSNRA